MSHQTSVSLPNARSIERRMRVVLKEPVVGAFDAFAEPGAVTPSKGVQPRNVEQLPGGAVRLRRVVNDVGGGVDDAADQVGEGGDRDFLTRADVDVQGGVVVLHQKQMRSG